VVSSCCEPAEALARKRPDLLLWSTLGLLAAACAAMPFLPESGAGLAGRFGAYAHAAASILGQIWWGIVLGVLFGGVLARVPQEIVIGLIGQGGTVRGVLRASLSGVLLDLCSHGILLVAMRLYQRGASLGQTLAFLIASPWNSFSLTLVLVGLIGLGWTVLFVLLSMLIAIVAGLVCERLVASGRLPGNPASITLPSDFRLADAVSSAWRDTRLSTSLLRSIVVDGVRGSRMVLRWLFLGIVIAAAIRAFVPGEILRTLFGPGLSGLLATLLATMLIEVCSEGSTPIAADLFTRAAAPGNAFAFLMGGVSTDYTELMALWETTGSWRIAWALPLLTLPQVLLVGALLNHLA
jgi:hypothetical protein